MTSPILYCPGDCLSPATRHQVERELMEDDTLQSLNCYYQAKDGEPVICYSTDWIYLRYGGEITAIPRNPRSVMTIPWLVPQPGTKRGI